MINTQVIYFVFFFLGVILAEIFIAHVQKKRHTCGVMKFDILQPDHPINILFYEPVENLEDKDYIILIISKSADSRK